MKSKNKIKKKEERTINIYLTEEGTILKCKGGKYVVEKDGKIIKEIPSNLVESVNIYSGANITSPCIYRMVENNILIAWFSSSNQLIGIAENIKNINSELVEKQMRFRQNENKCLEISRKVIKGKLKNACVILRRYNRNRNNGKIKETIEEIKKNIKNINLTKSLLELYGVEGIGSRLYFKGISEILGKEYIFEGRSKRPPKDPYNSLISFGYSILYSEILIMIKQEKLSPYYGFMHKVRNGHASLASDIIEEFRYQIVDSIVASSLDNKEFKSEDFQVSSYNSGVYLDKELRKKFVKKIINKINDTHKYNGIEESYRETIKKQIKEYKHIISTGEGEYTPFLIR